MHTRLSAGFPPACPVFFRRREESAPSRPCPGPRRADRHIGRGAGDRRGAGAGLKRALASSAKGLASGYLHLPQETKMKFIKTPEDSRDRFFRNEISLQRAGYSRSASRLRPNHLPHWRCWSLLPGRLKYQCQTKEVKLIRRTFSSLWADWTARRGSGSW